MGERMVRGGRVKDEEDRDRKMRKKKKHKIKEVNRK